jgi:hypothetical protein
MLIFIFKISSLSTRHFDLVVKLNKNGEDDITWLRSMGYVARGGHGLPKVSTGLAMLVPSTPCGQAACSRLLPFWTPHGVPRHTTTKGFPVPKKQKKH